MLEIHLLAKLISGKGLAETHFCIPQEFWYALRFGLFNVFKVFDCAVYRFTLFRTHFKVGGAVFVRPFACAKLTHGGAYIIYGTVVPFVLVGVFVKTVKAVTFKNGVYVTVIEARAVGTHRRFLAKHGVAYRTCMELFFYTLLYITVGVAYFYVAVVSGNAVQLVSIDSRVYLGARGHILFKYVSHCCHRLNPSVLS